MSQETHRQEEISLVGRFLDSPEGSEFRVVTRRKLGSAAAKGFRVIKNLDDAMVLVGRLPKVVEPPPEPPPPHPADSNVNVYVTPEGRAKASTLRKKVLAARKKSPRGKSD